MRKAPKLTTKVLNPENCKQNVRTATAIFHEITAAAIQSYFPNKSSSVDFLKLFSKWWVFYKNNYPGNAAVTDDQKLSFLRATAEWVQAWQTESFAQLRKIYVDSTNWFSTCQNFVLHCLM